MEFSKLGNSGLTVSKIAYGNWINHGGKVNEDIANDCVKAALDVGITTFDTADVYSDTIAEEVLGRSLKEYMTRKHRTMYKSMPSDRTWKK